MIKTDNSVEVKVCLRGYAGDGFTGFEAMTLHGKGPEPRCVNGNCWAGVKRRFRRGYFNVGVQGRSFQRFFRQGKRKTAAANKENKVSREEIKENQGKNSRAYTPHGIEKKTFPRGFARKRPAGNILDAWARAGRRPGPIRHKRGAVFFPEPERALQSEKRAAPYTRKRPGKIPHKMLMNKRRIRFTGRFKPERAPGTESTAPGRNFLLQGSRHHNTLSLSTKKKPYIIVKKMRVKKTSRKYMIVPLVAAIMAGLFLRVFVFDIFRVEGRSMKPALMPGSILLVNRAAYGLRNPLNEGYICLWASPNADEILVYRDPWDGNFRIKRCAAISDQGIYVQGDNSPESVDSRLHGSVPVERIIGKVLISF
jgi:signal peptidase I